MVGIITSGRVGFHCHDGRTTSDIQKPVNEFLPWNDSHLARAFTCRKLMIIRLIEFLHSLQGRRWTLIGDLTAHISRTHEWLH